MRIILGLVFILAAEATALSQEPAEIIRLRTAVELNDIAETGKRGAFEVTKKFSICAGMYVALAERFTAKGKRAAGAQFHDIGNGAKLVAMYFWSPHSKNYYGTIESTITSSTKYYNALIELGGPGFKQLSGKMDECDRMGKLQSMVIDTMRGGN